MRPGLGGDEDLRRVTGLVHPRDLRVRHVRLRVDGGDDLAEGLLRGDGRIPGVDQGPRQQPHTTTLELSNHTVVAAASDAFVRAGTGADHIRPGTGSCQLVGVADDDILAHGAVARAALPAPNAECTNEKAEGERGHDAGCVGLGGGRRR